MTSRRTYGGRGSAARVITSIGGIFALIEIVYILMLIFGANHANGFFNLVKSIAEPLALFFPGLFSFASANLTVIVNYGLAAAFWLVITGIIARILGR